MYATPKPQRVPGENPINIGRYGTRLPNGDILMPRMELLPKDGVEAKTAEMKNYNFLLSELGMTKDKATAIAYGIKENGEPITLAQRARLAQDVAGPMRESLAKLQMQLANTLDAKRAEPIKAEVQRLEAALKRYDAIVEEAMGGSTGSKGKSKELPPVDGYGITVDE
jgi:hypothetical protein